MNWCGWCCKYQCLIIAMLLALLSHAGTASNYCYHQIYSIIQLKVVLFCMDTNINDFISFTNSLSIPLCDTVISLEFEE